MTVALTAAVVVLSAPYGVLFGPAGAAAGSPQASGLVVRGQYVRRWGPPLGQLPFVWVLHPQAPVVTVTAPGVVSWVVATTIYGTPDAGATTLSAPDATLSTTLVTPRWSGLTVRGYRVRQWGPHSGSTTPAEVPSTDRRAHIASAWLEAPAANAAQVASTWVEVPSSSLAVPRLIWYSGLSTWEGSGRWGPSGGRVNIGISAQVASTWLEVPTATRAASIAETSLAIPGLAAVGRISEVRVEIPTAQTVLAASVTVTAPSATAVYTTRQGLSAATVTLLAPKTSDQPQDAAAVTLSAPEAMLLGATSYVTAAEVTVTVPDPTYGQRAAVAKVWVEIGAVNRARVSRAQMVVPDAPASQAGDRIFGDRPRSILRTTLTDEDTDG